MGKELSTTPTPEAVRLAVEFDKVRLDKTSELLGVCAGVAILGVIPFLGPLADGNYPGLARDAAAVGILWWGALVWRVRVIADRFDNAANPNSGYQPTQWALCRAEKEIKNNALTPDNLRLDQA
ncbi:MAG: hypothetical protein AUJ12_05255 [Alphaproteobacteria bacterium CG1_02_46_17]|nr:MAG: hypothetical protein AUJ12_05255 [Alphaproteobacteria bacterium CG1_02_46_17]